MGKTVPCPKAMSSPTTRYASMFGWAPSRVVSLTSSPVGSPVLDGSVLCDGRVQGSAGSSRPVCGLSVLWSSQVVTQSLLEFIMDFSLYHLKSEGDYVDYISVGLLTAPSHQPLTHWQQ